MSIDPVGLSAVLPSTEFTAMPAPVGKPAPGFGPMVSQSLQSVNESLVRVDSEVRQLTAGTGPSLHEVMIHLEEARLSFQLLAQVRNRLLEAYQEVMRTQV